MNSMGLSIKEVVQESEGDYRRKMELTEFKEFFINTLAIKETEQGYRVLFGLMDSDQDKLVTPEQIVAFFGQTEKKAEATKPAPGNRGLTRHSA
jgi:hypothetical protein